MRRRRVLGDPRRRSRVLPQHRDRERKGRSRAAARAPRRDSTRRRSRAALRARSADFVRRSDKRLAKPAGRRRAATAAMNSGSVGVVIRPDRPAPPADGDARRDSANVSARRYDTRTPRNRWSPAPQPTRPRARRFSISSAPLELRMLALAFIIAVALVAAVALFPQDHQSAQSARSVGRHRHRRDRHDLRHSDRRHRSLGRLRRRASPASSSASALHHFPIPVAIALAVLAGAGIGLFSGLADRLFRPRRLRHHARRHGDRAQPRLYFLGPDLDQRHSAAN